MENTKEDYLEFINSESYKHQLDIWYRAYNIHREKIDLFYDFLNSLYVLLNKTYLGSDLIESEFDQKGHFNWCWDKTIENFSKENIHFKNRGVHYDYFWNFFLEAFYYKQTEGEQVKIPDYLKKLFNFKHQKSRSELNILSEVYKILNQNLKK